MSKPNLLQKFDRTESLLIGRSYYLTKLQLKSVGAISYTPYPTGQRLTLPTGQSDQFFTFGGSFTLANNIGQSNISVSQLPMLDHPTNFLFKGQSYKSESSTSTSVRFQYPLVTNSAKNDQTIIDSSMIKVVGTYPIGATRLVLQSNLPLFIGDQIILYNGTQNQNIVLTDVNNPNTAEWDVGLDLPTIFELSNNEVLLQVSSVCYWKDIPVTSLCYLALPVTTHLETDEAIVASFIRLKSGSTVLSYFYTLDSAVIIPGSIPSSSWMTADVQDGFTELQSGVTRLVVKGEGAVAKLNTIDQIPENTWLLTISSTMPGYITVTTDEIVVQKFEIVPGIQQKLITLSAFNYIELFSNQSIYIGDFVPQAVPTFVDVAIHVFNQQFLGSHVIANPKLVGLVLDPTLTWARTGQSKTNAGFKLKA